MTLSDFIEELNIAIQQDGHDIYCNAFTAEIVKRCLIKQNRMSKDIIYRQDAIDALKGQISVAGDINAKAVQNYIRMVNQRLHDLPSAQPEQIIRCTNCRFFKRNIPCTGGHYNGCEMWLDDGNEIRVMTDDYCSKALPKEGEQNGSNHTGN